MSNDFKFILLPLKDPDLYDAVIKMAVSLCTGVPVTGDSSLYNSLIEKWLSSLLPAVPRKELHDYIMSIIKGYPLIISQKNNEKDPERIVSLCSSNELIKFLESYIPVMTEHYRNLNISTSPMLVDDYSPVRITDENAWSIASKKRRIEGEPPTSSWWEVFNEEESSKVSLSQFTSQVENMRRQLIGLTISHDIVLPKNFDALFPKAYEVIRIIARRLDIKILDGTMILDPSHCTWKDVLNTFPFNEDHLSKVDPKGELAKGFFHIQEAIDFILRPYICVDSRPGLDAIRFLMASCLQGKFDRPLAQIEGCCIYTSKTLVDFEVAIRPLFPNIPEFGSIIISILKNIVGKITTSPNGEIYVKSFESIFRSLYKKDSAIYSLIYNKQRKKRLNADGITAKSQKKALLPKHYEEYTSIIKPSLELKQVPISTLELTFFKKVNSDLQVLETNISLKTNIDQVLRKAEASHIVQILHEKCKKVNNLVLSRKNRAHKKLVSLAGEPAPEPELRGSRIRMAPAPEKKGFTTEEWRAVLTPIIEQDEKVIIKLVRDEFCTNDLGNISWEMLARNIRTSQ